MSGAFRDIDASGFYDASLWEEAKTTGDASIRRLIDRGLEGSSVTVVLIGAETFTRRYVRYEIEKSLERGNGLLGIYIHSIKNFQRMADVKGPNPFEGIPARVGAGPDHIISLASLVPMYDWERDDGYNNLGKWVEAAATAWNR